MTHRTAYVQGDWNAICSLCGLAFKASELRKHWQGMYRCSSCFEPRHPQDFVRAVADRPTPPWTQPDTAHPVIAICTPNGTSAIPSFGVPGCLVPGYLHPFFDASVTD